MTPLSLTYFSDPSINFETQAPPIRGIENIRWKQGVALEKKLFCDLVKNRSHQMSGNQNELKKITSFPQDMNYQQLIPSINAKIYYTPSEK